MIFDYPYTDMHELNLDWFLAKFKELVEEWNQVQGEWTSLHDYVQNYFDNLNVQTEIDNKINAMIIDGSFATIVTPLVEAALPTIVDGKLPAVVASQISAVVAAQIGDVVAGQLPAVAASAAAAEVGTWLAAHVNPDTGYVIDDTLTIQGAAADAQKVGNDISYIQDIIGTQGKFIQDAHPGTNAFYKWFKELDPAKTYIFEVTSSTTATMTLTTGTESSGSNIVDTIATNYSFTANTPAYFEYTPSQAGLIYSRLFVATSWTLTIYEKISLWDNSEILEDKIKDNRLIIDNGFNYSESKNLFNRSDFITNHIFNSSGNLVPSANYSTTNPIYMQNGDVLTFTYLNAGQRVAGIMYYLTVFDTDYTFVSHDNSGLLSYTATADCIVYFVLLNSSIANWDSVKLFASLNSNDLSYYDEYGYNVIAKSVDKVESYKGVKWACVGDSMTEVNSTANKRYYEYIADELGFTTYNYGVGGSGYAARLGENKAFYQRIPDIAEDFDVITIFGSVNDIPLISGMGLGTYTDNTNATIAGCINLALDAIYDLKPFTKIGIIAPPPTAGNNPDGNLLGVAEQNYCDMLAQICKNRGIPYLDLYNCSGLKPWDADFREEFYKENGVQDSGVHPNSKGQEMISTKIREFIKAVI